MLGMQYIPPFTEPDAPPSRSTQPCGARLVTNGGEELRRSTQVEERERSTPAGRVIKMVRGLGMSIWMVGCFVKVRNSTDNNFESDAGAG